jgi:hypothetical protein
MAIRRALCCVGSPLLHCTQEDLSTPATDLVEPSPSSLLSLQLGEVVVVRHQVCHDGLVIWSWSVHICNTEIKGGKGRGGRERERRERGGERGKGEGREGKGREGGKGEGREGKGRGRKGGGRGRWREGGREGGREREREGESPKWNKNVTLKNFHTFSVQEP